MASPTPLTCEPAGTSSFVDFSAVSPDFSTHRCAQVLRDAGVVLIRDAIPANHLTPLLEDAEQIFDRMRADPGSGGGQQQLYEKYDCVVPYVVDGCFKTNLTAAVLLLFRSCAAYPILSEYFESDELIVALGQMLARHVVPGPRAYQTWHQDGRAVEFTKLITSWLPLSVCGRNAPSLQVAMQRYRYLLDLDGFPSVAAAEISETIWRPCYVPGDVMMFDPYIVHGTHVAEGMQDSRYSVEVRICREEDVHEWNCDRTQILYSLKRGDLTRAV